MYIAILCISAVAICTERVEAKQLNEICRIFRVRCNLHGACGGKAPYSRMSAASMMVAICTERVEAKNEAVEDEKKALEVAICTERVEAKQGKATRKGVKGALQSARSV